jgi:peptidoglycan hydrolase-like protein with peptidoglycan-binding domain
MDKLLPVILAALGNETIRNLVLSFLTKPQEQTITEIQRDVVAIKLDDVMRARVKAYQASNNLMADGVPGPVTLGHMLGKLGK